MKLEILILTIGLMAIYVYPNIIPDGLGQPEERISQDLELQAALAEIRQSNSAGKYIDTKCNVCEHL